MYFFGNKCCEHFLQTTLYSSSKNILTHKVIDRNLVVIGDPTWLKLGMAGNIDLSYYSFENFVENL